MTNWKDPLRASSDSLSGGLALGAALDLGLIDFTQALELSRRIRKQCVRVRRFSEVLLQLTDVDEFQLEQIMDDRTIICRCEDMSVAAAKQSLAENPHIGTSNAFKLRSRAGMGLCQGRYCTHMVTQLISRSTGRDCQRVGPFSANIPVIPIPISDLVR